jgi:phenylpropionate dioxygenase-like ring-hydroxylating dioxygenase large terminal subunit
MFLRNFWYVAAYGPEVTRNPLGRVILGEPIVFFRKEDGTSVALEDRCAHRHLPLSMGRLVGDLLQCRYHGLCYDGTGQCVKIPGQNAIPPLARVKAYPVAERHRWLWVWMGEAAQADETLIPDFHWLDDPQWGAKGSYLHVKANWQLIVDNLLDLTHLAFVHQSTIGNAALVENAAVKVTRTPNTVTVTRWIIDAPAPPTFVRAGGFTTPVDRWQIIDFAPPAYLRVDVGCTPPETETTSHYFWGQAHDWDIHKTALTDMLLAEITTAFQEDVAVFEAQQRNMTLMPNAPQVDINADSGVLQARRILDRIHREEPATAMAAAE